MPWILSSMLNEMDMSSVFFGDDVIVYMILTKVFKANPSPYSRVKSSLYYCFRKELAAIWLLPMAVAFRPA